MSSNTENDVIEANSSSSDEEVIMLPYNPFNSDPSFFNYLDDLSLSPLLRAVKKKDIDKVKELINAGKSLRVTDNSGNTALHFAVLGKRTEFVQLLLEHKIDVDQQNHEGNTPLLLALERKCHDSIIHQLIKAGADPNIRNNMETSALHVAVEQFSNEIIQLLIKHGADINAQDGWLCTPLYQAVVSNRTTAVHVLLFYGADTSILCGTGFTPFMRSLLDMDSLKIAKLLFPYYDDFTYEAPCGINAFQLAMQCSATHPILAYLIKAGVGCGYSCTDSALALEYALSTNDRNLFVRIMRQSNFSLSISEFERNITVLMGMHFTPTTATSEYFYDLVGSTIQNPFEYSVIIHKCLTWLLNYMHSQNIEQNNRKRLLWTFLTMGLNVKYSHISECCKLFGNRDEVEILYQCHRLQTPFRVVAPPVAYFFHNIRCSDDLTFIQNLESYYCVFLRNEIETFKKQHNFLYVGYITLSPMSFECIECSYVNIVQHPIREKLSVLHRIPPLIELSRNSCARYMIKKFNIKQPYQFFDIINRSSLPKSIKDILLFRKPVYPIETCLS